MIFFCNKTGCSFFVLVRTVHIKLITYITYCFGNGYEKPCLPKKKSLFLSHAAASQLNALWWIV